MNLLSFLLRSNGRKTFAVTAFGLLSGAASAGLIAIVNRTLRLEGEGSFAQWTLICGFIAFTAFKIGGSVISNLTMGRLLQDSVLELCSTLTRRIAATPLKALEELGSARILACLTDDIAVLSAAILAVPALLVNVSVLVGCAIYLAWISWQAAGILVLLTMVATFCYKHLLGKAYTAIRNAREGRDALFRHFGSLTAGIKEIQSHRGRREAFFREDLDASAGYLREQNIIAMNRYAVADGWSQSVFYLLLAALIFWFPAAHRISLQDLTTYVFAALYMMAPFWAIVGALPTFNRGQTSLARLNELGLTLSNSTASCGASQTPPPSRREPPVVELRNVTFAYPGGAFSLGPLDLTLHAGEMTFIIGGNGSGKSTLAKLLAGLYTPDKGSVWVDGVRLPSEKLDEYRELFSVVHSDFYLFDRLVGFSDEDVRNNALGYLTALELSHKVKIEGNAFSTTALSQGQRRRLALLAAYMEDRPIYVLDEWAADQDPVFREIFYRKLLPELKARGKTVVVITHDDRYFHLGDRLVKLDYGRIVEYMQPAVSA